MPVPGRVARVMRFDRAGCAAAWFRGDGPTFPPNRLGSAGKRPAEPSFAGAGGAGAVAETVMAEAEPGCGAGPAGEVAAHVAALRRYALVLVGDPHEADDLVQEALARVLAQVRAWRPVRDLRAYLFTTLHNVFVDGARKRRQRKEQVPLEDVLAGLAVPAAQPGRLELRDLVQGLAALPEQQRAVLLLVGLEGMSYLEAARVLDVPIGTVMSRLSRGREALRQLMTHGAVARLRVVK